jgi:hypothetical protein
MFSFENSIESASSFGTFVNRIRKLCFDFEGTVTITLYCKSHCSFPFTADKKALLKAAGQEEKQHIT